MRARPPWVNVINTNTYIRVRAMTLFAQHIDSLPVMISLIVTVSIAAWTDWRSWRIPNALVASSMAAGLMLALFSPNGAGIGDCLLGGLVGLSLFLPLYLLKGMAAGDVKLMAAIGMHVGPLMVIDIVLMTCLIGGAWAIVLMDLRRGTGPLSFLLVHLRSTTASAGMPGVDGGRQNLSGRDRLSMIPYGVVITMGTLVVVAISLTQG